MEGPLLPTPIPRTQITGTVDMRQQGIVDWSITYGSGPTLSAYLPLLPALSLPYGWLIADQTPQNIYNGLELTGSGMFSAIVTIDFGNGQIVIVEHISQGLSTVSPGLLRFSIQLSGSYPDAFDTSSVLLPTSINLYQQTAGSLSGNASRSGITISVEIVYNTQIIPPPPQDQSIQLILRHNPIRNSSTGLAFTSSSTLLFVVSQISGSAGGTVNNDTLSVAQITGTVDSEISSRVSWSLTIDPDTEQAMRYLYLFPAFILPAGWLTASQSPQQLRNGLETSTDATFTATVTLSFPSGEILIIEISSGGQRPQQPGTYDYTFTLSGSSPDGFDTLQILQYPILLEQSAQGTVTGTLNIPTQVTVMVTIVYPGREIAIPDGVSLLLIFTTIQQPTLVGSSTIVFTVDTQLLPSPVGPTTAVLPSTSLISATSTTPLFTTVAQTTTLPAPTSTQLSSLFVSPSITVQRKSLL